jgi:DNA excision repair protein ERCC-1
MTEKSQAKSQLPVAASNMAPSSSSENAAGSKVVDEKIALIVANRQRGNPVLSLIKCVQIVYSSDILADYQLGRGNIALFLSLRYYALHPNYLYSRMKEIRAVQCKLRVLLVLIDVDDSEKLLFDITRTCFIMDYTLLCAFSLPEAARYLETFKSFENKSVNVIKERVEGSYFPQAIDFLTTIRSVNKTDVLTLLSHFGSIAGIMNATEKQIAECPGFGEKKVKRLYDALHEPFTSTKNADLIQVELNDE